MGVGKGWGMVWVGGRMCINWHWGYHLIFSLVLIGGGTAYSQVGEYVEGGKCDLCVFGI